MRLAPRFALVGFVLAANAAAGPDKVRASATAATQPVDTVPLAVTPTPASGTTRPGDGQAPIANDTAGSGPVNGAATQALLQDVASSYNQMEQNIEVQFAKLKKQAKDDIDALEAKIKEMDRQIAALKEQAKKIEQIAKKMEELLPKLVAQVGSDPGAGRARTPSANDQLAARLKAELASAGLTLTPDEVQKVVNALGKGGSAGIALATQIIASIAEAHTKQIDGQVNSTTAAIKAQKDQISALEKQLVKLDQDKAKALADLRKQKEKALAEAAKAQDSRLIRIPTPTPTTKRP